MCLINKLLREFQIWHIVLLCSLLFAVTDLCLPATRIMTRKVKARCGGTERELLASSGMEDTRLSHKRGVKKPLLFHIYYSNNIPVARWYEKKLC